MSSISNKTPLIPDRSFRPRNVIDSLQTFEDAEVVEIARQQATNLSVLAMNVSFCKNVGNIVRTASFMGCENFYLYGCRKFDRSTAVGSYKYIPVTTIEYKEDLDEVLSKYDSIVSMEVDPRSTSLYTHTFDPFNKKTLLVVGAEDEGVPEYILERSTHILQVPRQGVLRCLNVSSVAAMAIAFYNSFLEK